MPKFSGFEVLTWLHARADLASIPVIVLSGSVYKEDHKMAIELGAVAFEIKPVDSTELVTIAERIRASVARRDHSGHLGVGYRARALITPVRLL